MSDTETHAVLCSETDSVSLCDAIKIDPLASACISALTDDMAGAGLKQLRLVSKQINSVMLRSISGYTLIIDGVSENLPDGDMLKLTKLSHLRVHAKADEDHSFGLNHVGQVQRFIAAAGPALHTVTSIDLKVSQEEHWNQIECCPERHLAAILSPFANVCTNLQQLNVFGNVGLSILAAFGAACKQLTRLETVDVPPETLEQLGKVLPQVTSTSMTLFDPELLYRDRSYVWERDDDGDDPLDEHHLAISTCTSLTSLDTGEAALTHATWRALPSCVQQLYIWTACGPADLENSGPPVRLQLPSLRKLCSYYPYVPLCLMANLLRAAPLLQSVMIGTVEMPCSVDQIPDLVLLSERLSAGLVIKSLAYEQGYLQRLLGQDDGRRLLLLVRDLADDPTESHIQEFACKLPVLESIVGLKLGNIEQPLLTEFARAFPRLRGLNVSKVMKPGGLPNLEAFSSLLSVCFDAHDSTFVMSELEAMCLQSPALLFLECKSMNRDACASLMQALEAHGRTVQVGDYRESSLPDVSCIAMQ